MIKRKNFKKGICSFLLLSLTVLCIPLQANAADGVKNYDAISRIVSCNRDKQNACMPGIYSDYQLDLEHSKSAFVKGYTKATAPDGKNDSTMYRVTNKEKKSSMFAIYRRGAKSLKKNENGKYTYLDVKVYYWVNERESGQDFKSNGQNAYYCGFGNGKYDEKLNKNGECGRVTIRKRGISGSKSIDLCQEYHFYKEGTLNNNGTGGTEVSNVSCTSCFSDIDSNECWIVKKNDVKADYATSKDATPNHECKPTVNGDGEITNYRDNEKTHIEKELANSKYFYRGYHQVEEKEGFCCTKNNHKVWVEWETNGRNGILLRYRALNRTSNANYDAEELYKTITFKHEVNGEEQAEITQNSDTTSLSGGKMEFKTKSKSPNSTAELKETAIGTMSRKILKYSKLDSLNPLSFYWKGNEICNSKKILKVDSVSENSDLMPDYDLIYMESGRPDKNTEITGNGTKITFKWYALYYIDYNANGGEGTMNKQTFRYGITQKSTENEFKKPNTLTYVFNDGRANETVTENSTFKEWNTKADGSGHVHGNKAGLTYHSKDENGGSLKKIAPLATETWYAQWKDPTVTLKTPTRAGYTFKGWYTDKALTKSAGTEITLNGNHTVYAKWVDETPPKIASITATPVTWSNSDGTVTIKASDKGSGLKKVELYRKSNKETSYSLVETFTENPATTADKTYTYTETTDGSHRYKAVAFDAAGNKTELESDVIYIDKTAPDTKKTKMKEPGERGAPVTKAYNSNVDPSKKGYVNSESYGLPVIIDTTDTNGSKDVSKIKYAYVKVYDTNNPSNVKYYDCGAGKRNDILKAGSDDEKIDVAEFMSEVTDDATAKARLTELNKLSVKREFIIDITRDFNKILNLTFEVHVIDYAGNDAFTTDTRLKKTHQRRMYVGGNIVRITKDNTLTEKNEFRSGYTGVVQIHTTGWVDRVDLKWTDEIIQASLKDAELNQPTMHYNVLLSMDPSVNPLMDLHGLPLNEPNEVVTLDTHDTTFTRNFYFRFWIPIYQEYTSEDDILGLPIDFVDPTEGNFSLTESVAVLDKEDGSGEKAMGMAQCIIEIGIIEGSSEMGLTKEEYENLGEIHAVSHN